MAPRPDRLRPMHVGAALRVVLRDLGIDEMAVIRRAGQPPSLLDGDGSQVSLDDFQALCDAVEAEAGGPAIGVSAGTAASTELFDPALFAAICSPDLRTALERMSEFKRAVGPFSLDVETDAASTTLRYRSKHPPDLPRLYGLSQLVFYVAFARRATRCEIAPRSVTAPGPVAELGAYGDYFGRPVTEGSHYTVSFAAFDARRPFLTHNDAMWRTFEPGLRRQMSAAGEHRPMRERVSEALFEQLPSGRAQIGEVAHELGIGSRTLQRRLAGEGTSWLEVLNETRERLARHYLATTELNPTEISLLLGFGDPNSLFRAFHRWTGTTPESWRAASRAAG